MEIPTTPQELSAVAAMAWAWAAEFLPRLGGALAILVIGLILARWAERIVVDIAGRSTRIEETVQPVLGAIVKYGILIFIFVAALGQLGVQTTSILTVLGAAGLAIALALQGTLSNIAAGLMLLWLRPFRVGEYVETPSVAGIVREIGLFVTRLDTYDGLYRFVPNAEIWNKPLVNYSRNAARLFNVSVGVGLDADTGRALETIGAVLAEDQRVLRSPSPEVFVDSMSDNFVFLGVRAWIGNGAFWPTHRALVLALKARLGAAGIPVQRLLHPAPDIGHPHPARRTSR
jgi:small conductance mechanosensitive channel